MAASSVGLRSAVAFELPLVLPLVLDTSFELSCSLTGENGGSEPESGGESGRLREEDDAATTALVVPFAAEYVLRKDSGDTVELGPVAMDKLLASSPGVVGAVATALLINTALVLPLAPFSSAVAN